MSDAAEREGSHETPVNPPDEPQEPRDPGPTGEEPGGPSVPAEPGGEPPEPPETTAEPPKPSEPPPQAEPGVYRCVGEIAGEHAILGVLTQGEEYDYRQVSDPRVLQAVAAYVELGVLEFVEGSEPASQEDAHRAEETPPDEPSDR